MSDTFNLSIEYAEPLHIYGVILAGTPLLAKNRMEVRRTRRQYRPVRTDRLTVTTLQHYISVHLWVE